MGDEKEDKTVRIDDRVKPDAVSGRSAMPCIVHFSDTLTGVTHWLSPSKELLIGRAPEADVCIPDKRVSQRHARVVTSPGGAVFIEDLGSTNGTYVNGEKVMRRALRDGDEVLLLPDYILKFCHQVNVAPEVAGRSGTDATRDTRTGDDARRDMLMRIDRDFIQARKLSEDLALLMVAVDGFAKIDEAHGQDAGDMVLREVTQVVGTVLRREDVLAQYENNTFAILLHNLNESGTVVLAQRIRRAVKYHHFSHKGEKIRVTVSLGIGSLTKNMKNAMDLIREVQAHLDKARSVGHDTINGSQSIRDIFRQIGNKHVA
jgi:diguanylate cyclase (GGDEF)-like protein